ncbi:low molecular weight protein arginine phosphatase [Staphylococcus shinii]|uniref:low molecular weight protein arginine phosphatase n=1 Tax=Staphylococcus shinii TaxID=2912228 RepID=UPI00298F0F8D|nr:low molecular weight protein arginine phosphatase [Staphylococcus shinii]MDW8568942.1 low molecular weight protein arginine phosphatase [Staphylococcus shinii]MDW8572478.1 low molecular weight protein arginine phosphatase [Staphylococcus shinii]
MRIVFVCTGNTCRSPLAESIAKAKLPNHTIVSRGIYAMDGQPISKHSLNIIEEKGLPVPEHAMSFTHEDLNADLILTMSQSHKLVIQQMGHGTANVFTLNEYAEIHGEVSDPFGGNKDDYIKIYNELNILIDSLKNKI